MPEGEESAARKVIVTGTDAELGLEMPEARKVTVTATDTDAEIVPETPKAEEPTARKVIVIERIGKQLASYRTCPNKTVLVKLLKEVTSAFSGLKQSESLKSSIKPLQDSITTHALLEHKDKDIRLLVGTCICEILRILEPNPEFSYATSREILRFLLSMFEELADTASPYFLRRAELLETFANLRFCLVVLDMGCEDLVLKMFKIFFRVVSYNSYVLLLWSLCAESDEVIRVSVVPFRENHPKSLINSMALMMVGILEEKVDMDPDFLDWDASYTFLDVILLNIIKERKGVTPSSFRLAVSVIQKCGEKLELCICHFLRACISNRDAVRSVIKESYHEIIVEIYQIAPQMILFVIPSLTDELLIDQVDTRFKALNLIRKLIDLPGGHIAREFPTLLVELLNKFSDKSPEVRLTALLCAKALYMAMPPERRPVEKTRSAIEAQLLDCDDKVRAEAIAVACDLAKIDLNFTSVDEEITTVCDLAETDLNSTSTDDVTTAARDLAGTGLNSKSVDLISKLLDRLRDKKIYVRSNALKHLVELYWEYCTRCEAGVTRKHLEAIPCELLMLCYVKDCPEFRPQRMELVLADLFPASLPIEEKMKHWIFMFSVFKAPHLKALKTILLQKRRLQDGLKDYLDTLSMAQENCRGEMDRKMDSLVVKMSSCFADRAKAEDYFQKLKELNRNGIYSLLKELLSEGTKLDCQTTKDAYVRELGDQPALIEFFHLLSKKCSFNIFGPRHVQYILDCLSSDKVEEKDLKHYQVLLLTIISAFPSLLRGSEKKFQLLLHKGVILFNEQLIEVLAREGCHLLIELRYIYSSLEKLCLEGTRAQSKLAVSAIAASSDVSKDSFLSKLCKVLVDSLSAGENVPTVLQSLGCMAQYCTSTFDGGEVIAQCIFDEIFQRCKALTSKEHFVDGTSNCCTCKLKVFGLKALVRSFLPQNQTHVSCSITSLLEIILQMLQKGRFSAGLFSCDCDEAFIRSAAAKSVLQLSRKWDLHISPQIFRLTILTAKDHSLTVRKSFASKIHKLLRIHAVPTRYACAFSFIASDSIEDLRSNALKHLVDLIQEYGNGAQMHNTKTLAEDANHPLYLVVFLIHILAYDSSFPAPDCRDEKVYSRFLSPLFVTVHALVHERLIDGSLRIMPNACSFLRSIFKAMKMADDAIDAQISPKLHLLAEMGISILDSLNCNNLRGPLTPGRVLLPSSLYKIRSSQMNETKAYPFADEAFMKNLVFSLRTEFSGSGKTAADHIQDLHDNSLRQVGTRHIRPSSESRHGRNPSTNQTCIDEPTAQCDPPNSKVDARQQQNLDMSSQLESLVLHDKVSVENKHGKDAHRNSGAKSSSTCGSVAMQPSSAQTTVLVSSSLTQKNDICVENVSRSVRRSKRCQEATRLSTSEVTLVNDNDMARRTRRRKA